MQSIRKIKRTKQQTQPKKVVTKLSNLCCQRIKQSDIIVKRPLITRWFIA